MFVAIGGGLSLGFYMVKQGWTWGLDVMSVAVAGLSVVPVLFQLVAPRRPPAAGVVLTLSGGLLYLGTIHPYPLVTMAVAAALAGTVAVSFVRERTRLAQVANIILCLLLTWAKARAVFWPM